MASTKADGNRVAWQYTDDGDNDYAVSAKAVFVLDGTDGAKYGGSAPASTVPPKPKQLRMRAVKCISAGHPTIYVPAYETDATIWTTPGTTLTRNLNGVDVEYTVAAKGKRAEKNPDGIRQTS